MKILNETAKNPPCKSKEVAEHVAIQQIRKPGARVMDKSIPEVVHDLVITKN